MIPVGRWLKGPTAVPVAEVLEEFPVRNVIPDFIGKGYLFDEIGFEQGPRELVFRIGL